MNTSRKVFYAVAFQTGWFVCTIANMWVSCVYTITFIVIHFFLLSNSYSSMKTGVKKTFLRKEALWIIAVLTGGLLLETISFSIGALVGSSPIVLTQITLPPFWLLNLWLLFAIALRTCMAFVFTKIRLTYLAASVAIPLNYYAGAALNSNVAVNDPYPISLALISVLWICLLWTVNRIKCRYFEDIFNAR